MRRPSILAALLLTGAVPQPSAAPPPLADPPGITSTVTVSTAAELDSALLGVASNTKILLNPGVYPVPSPYFRIHTGATNVVVRGATGNRDDVVLRGPGMGDSSVQFGIHIGNARDVLIADLSIGNVFNHSIHLNPGLGCDRVRMYNLRFFDAGEQLLKSSGNPGGAGVGDSRVEYCVFEYTGGAAPSWYTNAVDVHGGANWQIRHSLFRNIREPAGDPLAGPAVLMWNGSSNTLCEGNTFLNCARGISYGLVNTPGQHSGGIIRNNFFHRGAGQSGDVGIFLGHSPNTQVLNNTVLCSGTYGSPIEYRFSSTTGVVLANNLVDGSILARDGATGTQTTNFTGATAAMFVNPSAGDLHLVATATAAIDRGTSFANCPDDWDGSARPAGSAPDIGADEHGGAAPPPGPPPPAPPPASAHDKQRANSYDDAWEAAWTARGRSVYRTAGKTAGFVLEVGDSITHSNGYSQWPRGGAGRTAEDQAIVTWCMAGSWGAGQGDASNKNGWYLAAADTSGIRGMTASGGMDTSEFLSGSGNGGTPMPADPNPVTARGLVADGATYDGDLHVTTLASAFSDAQFAVLMLGTNDVNGGRSASAFVADLGGIVDALEARNIVVILSTIPPHFSANAAVLAFNAEIRGLAQSRGLALIDFYAEILARRPGTSWNGTLLALNDVHPTASGGGFNAASDPYTPGGSPGTHATGDACLNVGLLLRSWLTIQKLKEVKQYVADGVSPPPPPPPGPPPPPNATGSGGDNPNGDRGLNDRCSCGSVSAPAGLPAGACLAAIALLLAAALPRR